MAKTTRLKAKVSGNVVEFWEYESPIFLEGNGSGGRRSKDQPESEKAAEHKKQNSRRSKAEFRSLVSSNFSDGDKFITLTFRDTTKFDIRNVQETNKEFKKFIQRIKYKYGDFKYIAVVEFQDENKRGAVHYHMICKLPFVPFEDLTTIWGLGFVGINRIEGIDNIGAYISKYMAKDLGDLRLKGKKNYLPSKNLDKPVTLYGSDAKKLLNQYTKGQKKEVFLDSYESEHFGTITYKEYNLKRDVKETKIGKGMADKITADQQIQSFKDQKYSKVASLRDDVMQLLEDQEKKFRGI